MTQELTFEPITNHCPGIIERLLAESCADLPPTDIEWARWREADRETFENPETVGKSTFITCLDGEPVGMGSYDPRARPETGVIGHNGILPGYRGRGFGKRQIEEILRRMRELGIRTVVVSTGDHPFFAAAQRMYPACGFNEIRRGWKDGESRFRVIEYEKELS